MIQNKQYTTIHRVLDNLKDSPLLSDLTLEQAVRYTLRFTGLVGMPQMYQDKEVEVVIEEYRGLLPCDLVSIQQVKDLETGLCMNSMTDSFSGQLPDHQYASFKANECVIFTSFPEGTVQIAYKAIPIDDDGFPLLMDNEVYLEALEKYITMNILKQKFQVGKISGGVYQDAQQDYYAAVKHLEGELRAPSPAELETIGRIWNTMLPSRHQFEQGYTTLGVKEYMRKH